MSASSECSICCCLFDIFSVFFYAAAGVHVRAHHPDHDDIRAVQAVVEQLRGAHSLPAFHPGGVSLEWGLLLL